MLCCCKHPSFVASSPFIIIIICINLKSALTSEERHWYNLMLAPLLCKNSAVSLYSTKQNVNR